MAVQNTLQIKCANVACRESFRDGWHKVAMCCNYPIHLSCITEMAGLYCFNNRAVYTDFFVHSTPQHNLRCAFLNCEANFSSGWYRLTDCCDNIAHEPCIFNMTPGNANKCCSNQDMRPATEPRRIYLIFRAPTLNNVEGGPVGDEEAIFNHIIHLAPNLGDNGNHANE